MAPLDAYFDREANTYACPTCQAFPKIPLITLTNPKTGATEVFYMPTPKQAEAMLCPVRNLLWGGRAGVGKSVWLRNEAYHRCITTPGYRALILRRNYTELADTHLDKAAIEAETLGAIYYRTEKVVVFKNGSRLRFGHCDDDTSVKQYLSAEFDWIGFDEGATFTEFQVRFIASRLRTRKGSGRVPLLRIGSNPGAMWLYRYFISKEVSQDDDPSYDPANYRFIPAVADDNSHISREEYEMRLNMIPTEALRKMYRDGDWTAVEGQMFTEWRPTRLSEDESRVIPWHTITSLPTIVDPTTGQRVSVADCPWIPVSRVLDWGYSPDPGVVTWFLHMPSGRFIAFREWVFRETLIGDVAEGVKERSSHMKIRRSLAGHDLWMTSKDTGLTMAETSSRHGVTWTCATTDRIQGWQAVHALLRETVDEGDGPVPRLQVYIGGDDGPGCPQLAQSLPMLQNDPKDPGDCLQKDDHSPDTLRYFAIERPVAAKVPPRPTAWSRLSPASKARILLAGRKGSFLGSESVRR